MEDVVLEESGNCTSVDGEHLYVKSTVANDNED